MADRIELRGLRALGTHGVLPAERQQAQPFEVDIDIDADLRRSGRSDALADTIDYGAVAETIQRVVAGPHADLLEHLAERIAEAVLALAGPGPVTVTVRKLRPPVPVDLSSAGVRITRP